MGSRRQGDLGRAELPIPGDIPGAGRAREEDLNLGEIRDWLKSV